MAKLEVWRGSMHDDKTVGGITIETITVSPFSENCMIVACGATRKAAVVDPGDEAPRILARVRQLGLEVSRILLTHGHIDHIAATGEIKAETGAPIHLHRGDLALYEKMSEQARAFGLPVEERLPEVDVFVDEGSVVEVGDLSLEVIFTPGHSPGSVCYLHRGDENARDEFSRDGFVFSGDVLFAGSIGRTDLWGGSYATLMNSIGRKLMALPETTRIYSGHGPMTTVGRERLSNPFSRDFVSNII